MVVSLDRVSIIEKVAFDRALMWERGLAKPRAGGKTFQPKEIASVKALRRNCLG